MGYRQSRRDRRRLRARDLTVRRRQLKRADRQAFNRTVRIYLGS